MSSVGLCTGAAGGIGRAISLRLVDFGCREITIADIQGTGLQETEELIRQISPSTSVNRVVCDLTEDDAPEQLVRSHVHKFTRLDYLVNCAGIPGGFLTATETNLGVFDSVQRLNVRSTWQLQNHGIRQMLKQEMVGQQ